MELLAAFFALAIQAQWAPVRLDDDSMAFRGGGGTPGSFRVVGACAEQ